MTVASAFEAWVEHKRAAQEYRAKVHGSVLRLLHRTLFFAFAAWQELAAYKAHQRAQVLSCVAMISNRVRHFYTFGLSDYAIGFDVSESAVCCAA